MSNLFSCHRFANEEFEQGVFEGRVHDTVTHETLRRVESVIEFTNISGAGLLHNRRSPAVLAVYKCPVIMNVNITNCASHGISLISPQDTVSLLFNWLVFSPRNYLFVFSNSFTILIMVILCYFFYLQTTHTNYITLFHIDV